MRKTFVTISISALAGLLVGYWLYPQLNPIEGVVEKSQSKPAEDWGNEPGLIVNNAQDVNVQSILIGEDSPVSSNNNTTPAEVLTDTRLNRLKVEKSEAKPPEGKTVKSRGRETLRAVGSMEDFSNHELFFRSRKWKEAGENFGDGTEYEQWAQDMHRNITDFIQNSKLAYDIYIERVNCNSQGCEVVGKDDATKSWQRIVWGMQSQQWWNLKGTKNSSKNVTREGEGYFYYTFNRY